VFENRPLANLALGRSMVRQRILALLIEQPGTRLHLREIQRRAATSPGTASRELARLVAAGLIEREPEGSQVYFRASDSPATALLLSLLTGTLLPAAQPPARRSTGAARPRASRGVASPAAADRPTAGAALPRPNLAAARVAEPLPSPAPATAEELAPTAAAPTQDLRIDTAAPDAPPTPARSTQPEAWPVTHFRATQREFPSTAGAEPTVGASVGSTAGPTAAAATPETVSPFMVGIQRAPEPIQRTAGPRGNLPAKPEGPDLEALIAAIQKRGPVDDIAARAGAMLAPSLRWLYGERLSGAYLFGDRTKGHATASSPVEFLVVLDRIERYGEEVERTSLACASVSLELDVVVSRVFLADADWFLRPAVRSLPALAGAVKL
jgi:hypothetical protein